MNGCFYPLIVQMQELSLKLAQVQATASVQQIQIYDTLWRNRIQQAITLTTLEEILRQLWALQPPAESEAEFISKIYVFNSNSQDSSNESANTGVDPNYKSPSNRCLIQKLQPLLPFLLSIRQLCQIIQA
ncbi:hypothetical protein DSO57_1031715 [Entomophthora muscae]|uniref:Uncharacterized protein n=1 Tax=Entomophthora muscae TaxID=34485 RepID=A0ACC2RRL7_9FUNG|nr:hypothetical protein DSO57_1031715 [Entomophthora muscae]